MAFSFDSRRARCIPGALFFCAFLGRTWVEGFTSMLECESGLRGT